MKKIFLDTNVILDYYLNRFGADAVEKIFILANAGKLVLFASTLTFANFAYVIKREHSKEEFYAVLDEVEKHVYALPMDKEQLRNAIDQPCKDFEDMLQYQCALAGGCDVIITNNRKDFAEYSKLPLFTATEYISNLRGL